MSHTAPADAAPQPAPSPKRVWTTPRVIVATDTTETMGSGGQPPNDYSAPSVAAGAS